MNGWGSDHDWLLSGRVFSTVRCQPVSARRAGEDRQLAGRQPLLTVALHALRGGHHHSGLGSHTGRLRNNGDVTQLNLVPIHGSLPDGRAIFRTVANLITDQRNGERLYNLKRINRTIKHMRVYFKKKFRKSAMQYNTCAELWIFAESS